MESVQLFTKELKLCLQYDAVFPVLLKMLLSLGFIIKVMFMSLCSNTPEILFLIYFEKFKAINHSTVFLFLNTNWNQLTEVQVRRKKRGCPPPPISNHQMCRWLKNLCYTSKDRAVTLIAGICSSQDVILLFL